jgi:hypothetical protein
MGEFADGLEHDLQKIKEHMAEHARSTDAYFEGMKSQADHMKSRLQNSMEALSTEFKVFHSPI